MKTICIIVAALLQSFQSASLLAAEPARGWAKTTWGMSKAQVAALYPEAKPLPLPPEGPTPGNGFGGYKIPDYQIDGERFEVMFSFDEGGTLRQVSISSPAKAEVLVKAAATKLEQGLIQKYGAPTATRAEESGRKLMWVRPEMVIKFKYASFPEFNQWMAFVTYEKPDAEINEKL